MSISKRMALDSLAFIVIAILLFSLGRTFQSNGELLSAYACVFTSNIVMLIYLFGTRKNIKKLQETTNGKK